MTTSGTAPTQPYPLSTRIAIEALGSFFIVFAGLATALFSSSASAVAFSYGLAMVGALTAFGHVSRGYFNPAFTVALAVAGRIKWLPALFYVVAQTVGALLSAVVLYGLVKVMPSSATSGVSKIFATLANGYDSHSPSQVPMIGVLIVEIAAMAILAAVVLGATSARNNTSMAPLAIGLSFGVAMTIMLPMSNGSLNPARATSVVFLSDSWAIGQLWLFWLAPLFGAALAAAIYRTFQPVAPLPADDAAASLGGDSADASSEEGDEGVGAAAGEALPAPVPASSANDAPQAAAEPAVATSSGKSDAQDFFDSPNN
ncbi:aquaporin [Arthrobacter sp. A2-55]|uniref:aquaporin n=1 Tax=Arthrobacter sp. A2-55 TaxID=2897337 RepID=UPI0021CDA1DE|nr:aquaporin [Arthrobacter sp. A2-55]MCU6480962.1 aquaporin [Arthrobacter sp. A2-55]